MKKIITLLVMMVLCVLCLASCGKKDDKPAKTTPEVTTPEVTTPEATTPEATTPEVTTPEVTTPEATTPEATTPGVSQSLKDARSYIRNLYKDRPEVITSNEDRVAKVTVGADQFTVTWTVNVTSGPTDIVTVTLKEDGALATINVNYGAHLTEDVVFTLVATISDGNEESIQVEFNHKVPAFAVNTWEEYKAAENDAPLVVEGVVTGIIAKSKGNTYNCLYIQDEVGGYYVYALTEDPVTDLGIAVGMTVRVSGVKDNYSGTLEIKNGGVTIQDSTVQEITPVDYTELFINAADTKATELVDKQGLYVELKGVTLTTVQESNGYYNFELGGKTSYIRLSSSVCPLTKAEQAEFIAKHKQGYIVDVKGVICVYNGAFYLTPISVDAIANEQLPELGDADAVQFEKEALTLVEKVSKNSEITLPATGVAYDKVAITWDVEGECAVINEGKLVITLPEADTTIKVIATLTAGEATDTKEFEIAIVLPPATPISLTEAIELCGNTKNVYTEDKYLIAGIVKEVQNTTYGNIVITDGTTDLLIYGTYSADGTLRYDAMEVKPVVGDYVVVYGILGYYNAPQMKNGWIMNQSLSYEEAIELCGTTKNEYTEDKYLIAGTVKEVQNTTYGNILITDGTTDLLIYGTYSADGTLRYDAMEVKPVVGDTVVVSGILGYYNAPQMKNGWLVCHIKGVSEQPGEGNENQTPVEGLPANLAFADAVNKADGDALFKQNYANWAITGVLGQTYGGYLGFGRGTGATKETAITSNAFSVETAFGVKLVAKGNGSEGVATSKLVVTLVDASGNVVATGYQDDVCDLVPADQTDTTFNLTFKFVDGKSWSDATNLKVSFTKVVGNIGLKSLDFVAIAA